MYKNRKLCKSKNLLLSLFVSNIADIHNEIFHKTDYTKLYSEFYLKARKIVYSCNPFLKHEINIYN